jgi:ferredoxin
MNFTQHQTSDTIRPMADRNDKNPRNVPGKYYNDLTCIDCDLCREIAPQVFTRDDDEGLSYVWKQPATSEEIAAAEEARQSCPTETIGDDG